MPIALSDTLTFTTPVTCIADGDGIAQANFSPGLQALANRTAYLNNLLSTVGVPFLRSGTISAMSALTGVVNGTQFLAVGYGLYTYLAASALSVDNLLVFASSSGGQWIHELYSVANTNPGFAAIGTAGAGTGKLLGSLVPNNITSIKSVYGTASLATTSSSYINIPSLTITPNPVPAVGDIIIASTYFFASADAGLTSAGQRIVVVDGGTQFGMPGASNPYLYSSGTSNVVPAKVNGTYTVASGGTVVVDAQYHSDGTRNLYTGTDYGLTVMVIHP